MQPKEDYDDPNHLVQQKYIHTNAKDHCKRWINLATISKTKELFTQMPIATELSFINSINLRCD